MNAHILRQLVAATHLSTLRVTSGYEKFLDWGKSPPKTPL